jgi:hypothetical protein
MIVEQLAEWELVGENPRPCHFFPLQIPITWLRNEVTGFRVINCRWGSVVGIETGYAAGRLRGRSSSPCRVKNFLFSKSFRPGLWLSQPTIQFVLGAVSPGVKRPRHEADHSPPASAEVKKMWIYTSTILYAFAIFVGTCCAVCRRYFHESEDCDTV